MVTVSETIYVNAPVENVFTYLDDPYHHIEITPSLVEVRNVEPLDNGGKRADHTYRMAGVSLDGELVEILHEENQRLNFELRGQLEGELDLRFTEENDGTRVSYAATYKLPGRVLSRLAEPFVRRYNQRELRTTLQNLKDRLEVDAPSQ